MMNRFTEKLQGFGPLDDAALNTVERLTKHPTTYAAHLDLIREGDRPGPVFVMIEGWSMRYTILPTGSRQVLAFLMPGDCCDPHIGLLEEMDHSIQTITSARIATIGRQDIDDAMQQHVDLARAMYMAQLVDSGTMRAWITSMGRRTSIERTAHLLWELYLRAHNIGLSSDGIFEMPLSQLLLADALGMTPVHLNRVLRELRIANAVEIVRKRLLITDPAKLVQIAGFDEGYLHRRLRKVA